jgi:hypothetical protein
LSFRQKNKSGENLWRNNHRQELLAAGLPEMVVDNERCWNYMILHGDDVYQSGWQPTMINKEQATQLLQLLRCQSFWEESTGHENFSRADQ